MKITLLNSAILTAFGTFDFQPFSLSDAREPVKNSTVDSAIGHAATNGENFEPYDAGLLVIDLAAKVILADSTYSYYSTEGTVRIKTDDGDDFN